MNIDRLLGVIKTFGDRQEDLANAMGISRTTLSAKIHGRRGATFTLPELVAIRQRYGLTSEEVDAIFFAPCVS